MKLPERIAPADGEQPIHDSWESLDVDAEFKRLAKEIDQEFAKIDSRFDSPDKNKNLTVGPLPNSKPKVQSSIEVPHFQPTEKHARKEFAPPTVPNSPKPHHTDRPEIPKIQSTSLHFTDEDFIKSEKQFSAIEQSKVHHKKQETDKKNVDLGEKAREIRKKHKRIGQKILATMLVATTVATAASAIKKDKKDPYITETTHSISTENTIDNLAEQDAAMTFNEDMSEITIHQETETSAENSETTEAETAATGQATVESENIENPEDKIEMDMNVKLELTDSMKKQLEEIKNIYEKNIQTYKDIANTVKEETGLNVLPEMICAIHYRESGCDFSTYLHNGQKLGKTTTLVPTGIYFENFAPAAADAIKREISQFKYNTKRFGLKNDLSTLSSIAMFTETFNGTGARDYHNASSSYVYTGTNLYEGGMYTGDGEWSDSTEDGRVGTLPIIMYLNQQAEEA